MANFVELSIDQGSTYSTTLSLKDVNGDPTDLTLFTYASQLRKSYYSANSVSFVCTAPVPNTGNLIISLSANTTLNIDPGRYVFDVELISNTSIIRVVEGVITITPGVTR